MSAAIKVLQVNTTDIAGGAAKAAYRLHRGMLDLGLFSQMMVRENKTKSHTVVRTASIATRLAPPVNRLGLKPYTQRDTVLFSSQKFPGISPPQVQSFNPDVIHLHWICDGYLKIETLAKLQVPIVWTLHDMWPFTGGCHYSQSCDRYTQNCGQCPILGSQRTHDLSFKTLRRKQSAWKDLNLTVVTPSHWLSDCAQRSSLFQGKDIRVIPNGIDTSLFRPGLKQTARTLLKLPQDQKIILFVADSTTGDPRKGFRYLADALKQLQAYATPFELAILGEEAPLDPPDWGFKTHYLGRFTDEIALAHVYNASDVFIAPSREDNLPNTIVEALACGTPCIAFDIGGMPDLIQHKTNGYLAQPFNIDSLVSGILWVLEDEQRHQALCVQARQHACQHYDISNQSAAYHSLYKTLLTL